MDKGNTIEIRDFCSDFDNYLMVKFCYKKPLIYVSRNILNIDNRKRVNLYCRYDPQGMYPKNTFVIAKIAFTPSRSGSGTDLLKFLLTIRKKYNIEFIAIESGHSESVQGFANRFQFISMDNHYNYIKKTSELENLFSEEYND